MTRCWEYLPEEVIFKVATPGRKEEKVPKGRRGSRYRALEARELHSPRTETGPVERVQPLSD